MIKNTGNLRTTQLTDLLQNMDTQLMSGLKQEQLALGGTNTPTGGSGSSAVELADGKFNSSFADGVTYVTTADNTGSFGPGRVWTTQPDPPPARDVCMIMYTGNGEFVITGDLKILRKYFESDPELWLRCAALVRKEENG